MNYNFCGWDCFLWWKEYAEKSFKTIWIWKNAIKIKFSTILCKKKSHFWFTKIFHVPKLIFKKKINRNFLLWLDFILNILLFSLSDINNLNKFVVKKNWIKTQIGVSTKIPHYINNFWWLNFSYFNFNFLFKYYDYFSYIICQFFLNMCILLSF